jgi:hypothetical protein
MKRHRHYTLKQIDSSMYTQLVNCRLNDMRISSSTAPHELHTAYSLYKHDLHKKLSGHCPVEIIKLSGVKLATLATKLFTATVFEYASRITHQSVHHQHVRHAA